MAGRLDGMVACMLHANPPSAIAGKQSNRFEATIVLEVRHRG